MTELVRTIRYSKYYLLVAAFLVAFFTTTLYLNSLTENIEERTKSVLSDATAHLYNSFDIKIMGEWNTLAPIAHAAAGDEDFLHSEELRDMMLDMQEACGYDLVFAADPKGQTITTGDNLLYIGDREYFKQTIQGENTVSDVILSRATRKPVIVISVPVKYNAEIKGILCAAILVDEFRGISDVSIFEGKGDAYVTSRDGDPIITSDREVRILHYPDIFQYFANAGLNGGVTAGTLRSDFSDGQEGFFSYAEGEDRAYAYYAPLSMNDWYVICTVPASVIDVQTNLLRTMTFWMTAGLLLAFVIILAFVMLAGKESRELLRERNRELEINEHRFRMASSLSNNVVVEWNILERELIFLNGYENIFPEPILTDYPESAVQRKLVHPDNAEEFLRMHRDIPPGVNAISGEFQFFGVNKKYVWCRLDELLLFNDEGKPIRTIGRITNIDNQRAELERLQSKARLDSGTGLYNKEATGLLVGESLKQEPAGKHSLLIIDIDDFKDINDQRGHIEGDRILLNIAETLKELFRASDVIGRIGGDEFMLFAKNIGDELFLEAKLLRLSEELRVRDNVTVSIGISRYPKDGTDFMRLYHCADIAMYEAKARGKGSFAFYNE